MSETPEDPAHGTVHAAGRSAPKPWERVRRPRPAHRNSAPAGPKRPTGGQSPAFIIDRLAFQTGEERTVYLALRDAQAHMPEFESITIAPRCSIRVPGHTWEVDFLVTHKGRCGVIEVDGASHVGKWIADRSRDRLLLDAGIAYVDRIDAVDVNDPAELKTFVRRFLHRLVTS
jgi:hypothetical protein